MTRAPPCRGSADPTTLPCVHNLTVARCAAPLALLRSCTAPRDVSTVDASSSSSSSSSSAAAAASASRSDAPAVVRVYAMADAVAVAVATLRLE